MMFVGWLGFGCALLSMVGVVILAAIDPKRRRDARRAAHARVRWLLGLAIFLPGIALGVAGRWSDFLVWIGAAALLGWAVAALANMRWRRREPADSPE